VTNSPPPLPTPEQGSSLFRKIEQENADLRQQLAVEREALQGKTKSHDSLIAQVSEQRGQVERLSREMKDLKQDSRQVKAREAALRKALDKVARQSFQQQEEIARLQAEKAKVEGEKAQGSVPPLTGVAPLGQPKTKAESSESSDDTEGMLLAAQKALRAKRVREAEGLYEEALKKAPRNPSVHYNLGVLYADYLKNPDKAAQCFRKYLDLAPAARDAPLVRSWLLELDARTGR
jgi:tetratricopeptide (TPR) repeat protein